MTGHLSLVLGGARSGKSRFAETLAAQRAPEGDVLYVATAQAWDNEMQARIAHHQATRPAHWRTLETPQQVAAGVRAVLQTDPRRVVLLDCMALLTSNVVLRLGEGVGESDAVAAMHTELAPLLALRSEFAASWIVVSNEVGLGIVPAYPLGRLYRDVLGRVNQELAAAADTVHLLVAGLPLQIKPDSGRWGIGDQ